MVDVTYEDYQDLVRKLSLANERVRDLQERVSGRDACIAALEAQLAEAKAENARLREALTEIDALEVMEVNPSNYDHDDVCELNRNACYAATVARAALEATPAPMVTDAMELARAVLAQSITAGHNVPGPTPADIEKAFWALDAALKTANLR